jgi:eukaryotic-like serine/threonine-protein kinase
LTQTIGPYAILELLGEGGMGVVYRARDSRLGRDIALKVLPPQTVSNPQARARLIQEARLASSLNHPNICTIFDVGDNDDTVFVAMEWIEGRPLSQLIPSRGFPMEAVLQYGTQIADALAHAHARGVVHRDLKASNVVVTLEGRAKVLDFGIAKRIDTGPDDATLQLELTEPGAVLGTPAYLAPEVLRGQTAGPQSDIWALGVLLYEMCTGQMPFNGRTAHEFAAAILTQPALPMPPEVPAGLRTLIVRCLEKEPGQRLQQAAEIRASLEVLSSELRSPLPKTRHHKRNKPFALVGVASLILLVFLGWLLWRHPWRHPIMTQRQLTSNPVENPVLVASLSPDGRYLATLDKNGLAIRGIDSGDTRKIELPPGYEISIPTPRVDWYPDGTSLLLSGGHVSGETVTSIWALPLMGGKPRRIQNEGLGATISPDASRIAYTRHGSEIWCMEPNGENPRQLVPMDSSGVFPNPVWAQNGQRLVYGRGHIEAGQIHGQIETTDLEGHRHSIFDGGQRLAALTTFVWLRDGRLIFGLSDPAPGQTDFNLWSLQVDPRSGKASSKPVRITQWTRASLMLPTSASTAGDRMSVFFVRWQSDCYVGRLSAGDSSMTDVKRLTLDDLMDVDPAWTPDEAAILFASDRNGSLDVFRQRIDSNEAEPIVSGPGNQSSPKMSPNGAWILYQDVRGDSASIMRVPIQGGPSAKVMSVQAGSDFKVAATSSSECVVSEMRGSKTVFFSFDPVTGQGPEVARIEAGLLPPWCLSPDGSALAVVDARSAPIRIVVVPLSGAPRREVALRRSDVIGIQHLAWDGSGEGWLATTYFGKSWNLLHIDAKGHSVELLPPQLWMYSSALSPGRKRIVFSSNTVEANAWLLENF